MKNKSIFRLISLILSMGLISNVHALTRDANHSNKHGGTLNIAYVDESNGLVPIAGTGTSIGPKIVEGLFEFTPDLTPIPALARQWQVSNDGLTYTFKLRQGVKWHDGKPFTAQDVVFSLSKLKEIHPRGRITFSHIEKFEVPDLHTVVLKLSKPNPYLLTSLSASESPIFAKHLYDGDKKNLQNLLNKPIGTGPFIFKEWVKGSHIKLARNPDYWKPGRPYLDGIIIRFYSNPSIASIAFESGSVHLGVDTMPLSDVKRFQQNPKLDVSLEALTYVTANEQIYFNFDSEPFKKREVRLAVAHALDVDLLRKTIWYGLGTPSSAAIGAKLKKYHNESIQDYPFDLKEAERLLDQAGYPKKENGKRFEIKILINPSVRERRAIDFLRQSLQRIGINAQVDPVDFPTYISRVYKERKFDIVYETLSNFFDPSVGVQRVFHSRAFKIGVPFSNPSHYLNPEVDRLLDAATVEMDKNKRRDLFLQFQEIIHADVASIEIGIAPTVTILDKKLQNYGKEAYGSRSSFSDLYFADK